MNPPSSLTLTLGELQALNARIYGELNDRNYDTSDIVSRIHRYVTHILKLVRKQKRADAELLTCMAFSWTLALANRLRIDLDTELWKRFPNVCPYCDTKPCSCKERAAKRACVRVGKKRDRPKSFSEAQEMLRGIYPENTLTDAVIHLAEEAGEVDEAIKNYMGTHNPALFEEIVLELVDLVTNQSAVASCFGFDIATEMEKIFIDGCPKCGHTPCLCGYTTIAQTRAVA